MELLGPGEAGEGWKGSAGPPRPVCLAKALPLPLIPCQQLSCWKCTAVMFWGALTQAPLCHGGVRACTDSSSWWGLYAASHTSCWLSGLPALLCWAGQGNKVGNHPSSLPMSSENQACDCTSLMLKETVGPGGFSPKLSTKPKWVQGRVSCLALCVHAGQWG